MGYLTRVQVIQRGNGHRQYYLICPAPLAQALEFEKGETIEWVVQDKRTLIIRRGGGAEGRKRRRRHEGEGR